MRHLITLLLSLISICSTAQTLSEAQRQEALQTATKFCNLLVRFSNGERTLNSQINALCSGADCSAFDDIKTNKEITLRNYLMAIQQKYPKKLAMTISSPSLANSKTYIEPILNTSKSYQSVGDASTEFSTGEVTGFSVSQIENMYVVFDVTQKYITSGTTVNKKIIYDSKAKKITAFIKGDGAYISFLNACVALTENDHNKAMYLFEQAAQNNRSSLKDKSLKGAVACAVFTQNYEKGAYYANMCNDKFLFATCKVLQAIQDDNLLEQAYPHVQTMENMIDGYDADNATKGSSYVIMGLYYAISDDHHNMRKCIQHFKKADLLGDASAGYYIFVIPAMAQSTDDPDEYISSSDELISYLEKSANRGYPLAYIRMGQLEEYVRKNPTKALTWYKKSAEVGNHVAMACVGKLEINAGNKNEGAAWLRKALQGQDLETRLKDYSESGLTLPWPKSRLDVQTLLNTHSSTSSSSTSSSTNSYSTSSSNHSYYRRHKFNEPKDEYIIGLTAGYVQKQWVYDTDGHKEKVDVFGDSKYTNGIQFGIRFDPQFKYGFGINTGLFYEYYFDKLDLEEYDYQYHYTSSEHCLYMPLHIKYSLNFSEWFQLAFYGGIGLDYGLSGTINIKSDESDYDPINIYDEDLDMKRFNTSLEYGASIRVKNVQLDFSMSKGLINMSDNDDYKVKQNKLMNISVSYCF